MNVKSVKMNEWCNMPSRKQLRLLLINIFYAFILPHQMDVTIHYFLSLSSINVYRRGAVIILIFIKKPNVIWTKSNRTPIEDSWTLFCSPSQSLFKQTKVMKRRLNFKYKWIYLFQLMENRFLAHQRARMWEFLTNIC